MTESLDNHYTTARLAEIYDLDSGWSEDREFYLNLAGTTSKRILDLGCGTGLLCDAYAASGHKVTGVDPAEAMLDVARKKPHAKDIEWILSTAQNFKSPDLFDLIIMTGHAFQVLLTDLDIEAVFITMKKHLHPDGIIVFESRNPLIDWVKEWNYSLKLDTTDGIVKESRKLENFKNNLMTFTLEYEFPSDILTSTSVLRFWTKEEIERHLNRVDLTLVKVSGSWHDAPFEPSESKEMIFRVRHSR